MKNNPRTAKMALIISIISVIISIVGIILAVMTLRYSIANEKAIGSARTSFYSMITMFCCCTTILIININNYKKYSK